MSELSVTVIDVGWGDSILLESESDNGEVNYGLIDSNDTSDLRSSYIFLKRHFEKAGIDLGHDKPVFSFVLLTHAHTDHGQGLKALMREFGTERFWYPKSLQRGMLGHLLRYANRSSNVERHEAIDSDKILPAFGDAAMEALWPERDRIEDNENNNSVVLSLTLGDVSVVLTGDAEKEVWDEVAGSIPGDARFFKVPHHGAWDASLDGGDACWLDDCPNDTELGISSHVRPHPHPSSSVIRLFDDAGRTYYRTDQHHHVTFATDGATWWPKFTH